MTKKVHFYKMHGAGNDYIYINVENYPIENPEKKAIQWSAPHTGIGSDGLVLIGASDKADFSMRIFNADGSEALMCGNASRCIGKYVYEQGLTSKTDITLETLSGIKNILLQHITNGIVNEVSVDMGVPEIQGETVEIEVGEKKYTGTIVSMGNPHFVIFTDDVQAIDLPAIGPLIERHPLFPNRTNVEFAQRINDGEISVRVWERGSGITLACGTGACATLVSAALAGITGRKTVIRMDGGSLTIDWKQETGRVWMTGEATMVFEGDIELND